MRYFQAGVEEAGKFKGTDYIPESDNAHLADLREGKREVELPDRAQGLRESNNRKEHLLQ